MKEPINPAPIRHTVGEYAALSGPWTSATAHAFRAFELASDMMLMEIVKLAEENPVSFAASDIGQGFFRMYAYLLTVAGRKEVLDLRLRAMNDLRCRDRYSDEERSSVAADLKTLDAKPPETYPVMVSAADAMLHGDAITAQLLAHEYLADEDDPAAPEEIGADLSPYTLGAVERMRLVDREATFVDPFTTFARPPVFVEQVEKDAVIATAWLDGRETILSSDGGEPFSPFAKNDPFARVK